MGVIMNQNEKTYLENRIEETIAKMYESSSINQQMYLISRIITLIEILKVFKGGE